MNMRHARRPRLLIVGCGDIGLRLARLALPRFRVLALTSDPGRVPELRRAGIVPLVGNLDHAATLRRLAGLAGYVAMLAPPPSDGPRDTRTRHLAHALRSGMIGRAKRPTLTYASTTGVYGDCRGDLVAETRLPNPRTPRGRRRLDAETQWRRFGRETGTAVSILRIPGIYDDAARSPLRRLQQGLPVLRAEDDVYTSHIHADELARLVFAALLRGKPNRVYNVSDGTQLLMGDYYDRVARRHGLPPPPRVSRAGLAAAGLSPMAISFLEESRRLDITRMNELRKK